MFFSFFRNIFKKKKSWLLFFIISEVDINDNSEFCSKNDFYSSNEIDNIDSEEDVDINNKIKRTRENEDVNGYKGVVLKKFEDEYEMNIL
jgi:hypothetical protein